MGEFSLPHILIVLVIVLVFFGPSRLPGLGKSLGEAIRGFKQGITPEDNPNQASHQHQNQQQNLPHSQRVPPVLPVPPIHSNVQASNPGASVPTPNSTNDSDKNRS